LKLLSHLAGLPPKGDAVNLTKGLRELPPAVEEQLATYACGDADNTYGVFKWLLGLGFPLGELEVIDTTIRMFAEPKLGLDKPRARKLLASVIREKRSALRRLGVTKEQVSSTDKFAGLLEDRFGIEVELKAGKPKPDGTPRLLPALAKTDPFMKALLEHKNPDVQALASIRLEVKSTLEETRLYRMLSMHERGPMCVYLNFAGAHTFRWSGGDKMNWQNFTRGSELRRCVVAPKGKVLVVCDSSQIEARMLNTLAGQWDVLRDFESGDPYSAMAADVYERPINKKDNPGERQVGKVLELGCGYQMGGPKLKNTLRVGALGGQPVIVDLDTAKMYVRKYRARHPKVVEYWEQAEVALQLLHGRALDYPWGPMVLHDGKIIMPNGSRLDYTGLVREEGEWRMRDKAGALMRNQFGAPIRLYGGMLTENVDQGLSRVIIADVMREWRRLDLHRVWPFVMTSHDELVALAHESDGQACLDQMIACMTKRPSWLPQIPLAAEGGFDVCYSK
jgi:DNA polymerase